MTTTEDLAAERARLMDLLFGFFPAQVLRTLAELGVADALAAGPVGVDVLAGRTGAHPQALRRLLVAAAGLGLVRQAAGGAFELTSAGRLLRRGGAGSVGELARLFCGDMTWRAWGELPWSVRTGEPSYEKLAGRPAFAHLAADPDLGGVFTEAMAEGTRHAAPAIVATCDLAGVGTLCDVGGGNGTLLAAFLSARPDLRGMLLDTPDGLGDAERVLAPFGDRCIRVAGDFFTAVPACDAYVLKSVVHDWDDERAAALLTAVRAGAPPGATLFLVEPLLPSDGAALAEVPVLLMSDLNMLVCTGGRERALAEYRALLAATGWRPTGDRRADPTGYSVMTAHAAA